MTPPNESGTFLRTVVPPAALPADTVNTARTKPVPRDRVAEWKTLHTARGEHLRRYQHVRVFKTLCHRAAVCAGADEQAKPLRCRATAVPVEAQQPWLLHAVPAVELAWPLVQPRPQPSPVSWSSTW